MATVISLLDPAHSDAITNVVMAEANFTLAETSLPRDAAGEMIAPYPIRWSPAGDRILYASAVIDKGVTVGSLLSIAIAGGEPAVLVERFAMGFTWFDVASG